MIRGVSVGGSVQHYRLYWLDGAGKIATAEWLEANDDASARRQVHDRAEPQVCEIWERNRLVTRVEPRRA